MAAKSTKNGSKNLLIVIILLVGAAAAFGYFKQSSVLREDDSANAAEQQQAVQTPPAGHPIYSLREDDIVIGKPDAPITIVEYASLSCPHCAHFHETLLPKVKKEFIDNGKAKLTFRHFPLNEPAIRAAQLVECGGKDQREHLLKTLFSTQKDWAYDEKFFASLKKIAAVAGFDSARFEGCMADKQLENRILATRLDAAKGGGITSTPSFLINGEKIQGEATIEMFRAAMNKK